MLIVIYPDVVQVRAENPNVAVYARAAEVLSRSVGVPVLSGYPAFLDSDATRSNWAHSLVDPHPSCDAHAAFASWVLEQYRRLPN